MHRSLRLWASVRTGSAVANGVSAVRPLAAELSLSLPLRSSATVQPSRTTVRFYFTPTRVHQKSRGRETEEDEDVDVSGGEEFDQDFEGFDPNEADFDQEFDDVDFKYHKEIELPFDKPNFTPKDYKEMKLPWFARDQTAKKRANYDYRKFTEDDWKSLQVSMMHDPTGFLGMALPPKKQDFDPELMRQQVEGLKEKQKLYEETRRRNLAVRDRCFITTVGHYRVEGGGRQKTTYSSLLIGGNNNGFISYGVGRGLSAEESVAFAERNLLKNALYIPRTPWLGLPHSVRGKHNNTYCILRPKTMGTGIRASMLMYRVLEMAGITDCSARIIGKRRSIFITMHAIWDALAQIRDPVEMAQARGRVVYKELDPGYIQDVFGGYDKYRKDCETASELIDAVRANSVTMRAKIAETRKVGHARAVDLLDNYGGYLPTDAPKEVRLDN